METSPWIAARANSSLAIRPGAVGALNALSVKYKGKVEFILVYIREAHPTDGWRVKPNEHDGVLLETAKTFNQKVQHADSCVRNLSIKFTTVVDNLDNRH